MVTVYLFRFRELSGSRPLAFARWQAKSWMAPVKTKGARSSSLSGSNMASGRRFAPYLVPAQMAAEDAEKTGKSNPAMYFAIQGLFTAVVGAVSTGLIWPNLRNVTLPENEFFGTHLMPYIAILACVVSFIVSMKLPKSYDALGKEQ